MNGDTITFVEQRRDEVDWKEKATNLAHAIEALALICNTYRKCMLEAAKKEPEIPGGVKLRLLIEKLAVDKAMTEASEVLGKKYVPEESEHEPRI